MKKILIITAAIATMFCLTACDQKKQENPNELAKMTVGNNQIRYGDTIVNISSEFHCNIYEDSSFYYASGGTDDNQYSCRMDLDGASLSRDIDITRKTNYDYALGFEYGSDHDNPICSFSIDCHPAMGNEAYYGGGVKLGTMRVELQGETMTATLNAITTDGVIVQAKMVGDIAEW